VFSVSVADLPACPLSLPESSFLSDHPCFFKLPFLARSSLHANFRLFRVRLSHLSSFCASSLLLSMHFLFPLKVSLGGKSLQTQVITILVPVQISSRIESCWKLLRCSGRATIKDSVNLFDNTINLFLFCFLVLTKSFVLFYLIFDGNVHLSGFECVLQFGFLCARSSPSPDNFLFFITLIYLSVFRR
jgi:hypothetical protein